MEEKKLWAHHIKRLILENHQAVIPQKVCNDYWVLYLKTSKINLDILDGSLLGKGSNLGDGFYL